MIPFLPTGNYLSREYFYPRANYSKVNEGHTLAMDIYEQRRLKLIELINTQYGGKVSRLAKAIGKDSSYITRCKYPVDKQGSKRIKDEMLRAIYDNCNVPHGWMDGKGQTNNVIQIAKKNPVHDSALPQKLSADSIKSIKQLNQEGIELLEEFINNLSIGNIPSTTDKSKTGLAHYLMHLYEHLDADNKYSCGRIIETTYIIQRRNEGLNNDEILDEVKSLKSNYQIKNTVL